LYYKLDIFKLYHKGYNAILPDSLSENILKCRSNGSSLRGGDLLTVPRFQTRYIKDSLKYRGAFLWNTIYCYNEEVGCSSLVNLKNACSPETTLRNSNLTYFPLLLLVLCVPTFFFTKAPPKRSKHFKHNIAQHCWPSICKLRLNDYIISTQHIAILLGLTCCARLATLLRHVATCLVLKIELMLMPGRNIVAQAWPCNIHKCTNPQILHEKFDHFQI